MIWSAYVIERKENKLYDTMMLIEQTKQNDRQ